jgi:sporulation protein YlmC with PRC-barrel domain
MRVTWLSAAILAASFGALSAPALYADGTGGAQPARSSEAAGAGERSTDDTWKIVLPYQDIQGVLGKEVRSSAGEDMGRVVDVLVDQNGQVRAAVIDFGGFLGVGNRKVVVDWTALHFAPADQPDRISLDLTRNQIKQAPEYKPGKPVVVLGALAPAAGPDL